MWYCRLMANGSDGQRYHHSLEHMRHATSTLVRGAASAARLRTQTPSIAFEKASGVVLTDVDGNEYVDFALGLGPILIGHSTDFVLAAAEEAMRRGLVFAGQHRQEAEFADLVTQCLPSAEVVGLASTGTEGMHLAVRLARVRTGRTKVIKFAGHYHGWADPLFVNAPWMAGSEPTHNVPGLPAPPGITVLPWNDEEAIRGEFASSEEIAAVIMEPVPCNYGVFTPRPGYLEAVRELCDAHGTQLVFDEVLTGFRLSLGGAQEHLGVMPDVTVASKAMAQGFPGALIAGTRDALAPLESGPMRTGGTYNGSPPTMAAGVATLRYLQENRDRVYPHLSALGERLAAGLGDVAAASGAPLQVNQLGSVLQLFWGLDESPTDYEQALTDDREAVAKLAGALLRRGFHVPERGLMLLAASHTEEHIDAVVAAAKEALDDL